ncbi:hypothetical protein CRYUN_Cryun19dG0029000 [Craigia yunnanensis]
MAFLSEVGNILRRTTSMQIDTQLSASRPGLFQLFRCMSTSLSSKLFVGGISYQTDDQSLKEAFSKYGEVIDARVIVDRETGRSRGFGFVTYTSNEDASSALQALDGQTLHGRQVGVNYAAERPPRNFGGGGGGYGGGGGGYGGSSYGGGNYGGGSYGGNADSSAGNYGDNVGYGNSGGSGNYRGQGNYGGANYGTAEVGYGSGYGGDNVGVDGGDQLGSAEDGYTEEAGAFDQTDPLNENFRDEEDDTGDFAKRA